MRFQPRKQSIASGFTLTEVMVTTVIIGILSSVALPNYLNQVKRSRQNEAAAVVSQIQTTIATYADEFGLLPNSWADLNNINAVMTEDGPATESDFRKITLAGGFYEASITQSDNLFTITATTKDTNSNQESNEDVNTTAETDEEKEENQPLLNVTACLNLTNGASDINKGTPSSSAEKPNCGGEEV